MAAPAYLNEHMRGAYRRLSEASHTLGLILLCVGAIPGCYSFEDVTVRVHDGETGRPIENALVCVYHDRRDPFQPPVPGRKCVRAMRGTARVRGDPQFLPSVKVTEHDYMPVWAPFYNAANGQLTVDLYRKPAPSALVTLPAGYQGVVKIALRWRKHEDGKAVPDGSYPVGQRMFLFPLKSPDALEWFDWSPLIQRAMGERCYAVYDDGTPIPTARRGYPQSVAFRPLNSPMGRAGWGQVYLFYVGTLAEYEPLAREASFRNPGADQVAWIMRFGVQSDEPSNKSGN